MLNGVDVDCEAQVMMVEQFIAEAWGKPFSEWQSGLACFIFLCGLGI